MGSSLSSPRESSNPSPPFESAPRLARDGQQSEPNGRLLSSTRLTGLKQRLGKRFKPREEASTLRPGAPSSYYAAPYYGAPARNLRLAAPPPVIVGATPSYYGEPLAYLQSPLAGARLGTSGAKTAPLPMRYCTSPAGAECSPLVPLATRRPLTPPAVFLALNRRMLPEEQRGAPRLVKLGGLRGLNNLGNTCYMNCAVQCLSVSKPIKDLLDSGGLRPFAKTSSSSSSSSSSSVARSSRKPGRAADLARLVTELEALLREIWAERDVHLPQQEEGEELVTSSGIPPVAFKRQLDRTLPQFRGYEQHDSQEFLNALLDVILEDSSTSSVRREPWPAMPEINARVLRERSEEVLWREAWKEYQARVATPLAKTFQSLVASKIQCLECGELSLKYETSPILSVPVVDSSTGVPIGTLREALHAYFKPELLERDERWFCPRCKALRRAEKTTALKRCPRILIVHLKRFTFDGTFRKLTNDIKIGQERDADGRVVFSEALALAANNRDRRLWVPYRLFAVINHSGRYTDGHYSAHCLHPRLRQWFKFDDNCVRALQSDNIVGEASYVLFFRKLTQSAAAPAARKSTDL